MLRKPADAPIGLVVPVGKAGTGCQVLGDIHETAACTAGIGFLHAYHVVFAHQPRDTVQIVETLRVMEYVFPAMCQVLAIATGLDTDLYVIAQQAQYSVMRVLGLLGIRCF